MSKELTLHASPSQPDSSAQVACPICGPTVRHPFAQENDRWIVRCIECGLLFVPDRPTDAEVADYFSDEYISDEEFASTQMVSYREASLRREAAWIRHWQPSGGRLLDIGASCGTFLNQFAEQADWHVEGVEPSHIVRQYAIKRFGLKIHAGFLGEQRFTDGQFDVVTSLDTFMLHPEPVNDLQEIHRILAVGGLFAVEIPGLNFRLLKNTGPLCRVIYQDSVRLNAGVHLYYYSRDTLSRLLTNHGFELLRAYPEDTPSYGRAPARIAKKAFCLAAAGVYRATGGRANLAPKEFMIYRKVA